MTELQYTEKTLKQRTNTSEINHFSIGIITVLGAFRLLTNYMVIVVLVSWSDEWPVAWLHHI